VRVLAHFPPVVIVDHLVGGAPLGEVRGIVLPSHPLNSFEVVVLGLIEVGQVPVDADVLERNVVPLVVVGVVGHLVLVHCLSLAPHSSELDQLARVDLLGSAGLLLELPRDPPSVDDDGGALNVDGVIPIKEIFERELASFITVERVEDDVAFLLDSIDCLRLGDQDLLAVVKLTDNEVGLEFVVHVELLIRHAIPREVHLSPGGHVLHLRAEAVVTLTAHEVLAHVFPVVNVRQEAAEDADQEGAIAYVTAVFLG